MEKLSLIWKAFASSPWMMYAKLAAIAALVCAATYIAWDYRGALNERETTEAIADAVKEVNVELKIERGLRKYYQDLSDEKYEKLLQSVANIKATTTIVKQDVIHEIETNPEFYTMKLPPKGYESWLKARSLMTATPAVLPASSPASSARQ